MREQSIEVSVGSCTLRGVEWPGAGPLVLLSHATSFCAETWRPIWAAACTAGAAGCRAVALAQRGHGGSDSPPAPEDYAWTCLVDDLVRAIETLSPDAPAALVGHSSGGATALAAAGRLGSRVRAVAAIEPVLFERPEPGEDADSFAGSRLLAARTRRRRGAFESPEVARERLRSRLPYRGFAASTLEAFLESGLRQEPDGSVTLRCAPETEAVAYEGAAALDVWPWVERIEARVLVLQAESSSVPPELIQRLRTAVPALEIRQLARTTHFAALEAPEHTGRAIGRFLGR